MSALPVEEVGGALAAILSQVDGLAVLPHVVFKVLEISASEEAPPIDLERAILIDPGFSSKVLTLANSAYFGLPRRVKSIREAVMFLGFRAVRNLALTVGAYDLFAGKTDRDSLRRRSWWRHSVDSAVACKCLAFFTKQVDADDAYTCGLLHLIGKTLIDRFGNGSYDRVALMTDMGVADLTAESRVYGCQHIEVAVAAAEGWGFPETLVSGLAYLAPPDPEDPYRKLRACTALGSAIAEIATLRSQGGSDDPSMLPGWAIETLAIPAERVQNAVEQGLGAIAAAQLHLP